LRSTSGSFETVTILPGALHLVVSILHAKFDFVANAGEILLCLRELSVPFAQLALSSPRRKGRNSSECQSYRSSARRKEHCSSRYGAQMLPRPARIHTLPNELRARSQASFPFR
jgi:hypothetical protein